MSIKEQVSGYISKLFSKWSVEFSALITVSFG